MDLVDKILNVVNTVSTQRFFDDSVGRKRYSLLVNFTVSSLEDKFSDSLSRRISESNVRFNSSHDVS